MTDSRRQEIERLVNEYHSASFSDGSRGWSSQAADNARAALLSAIDALLKDAERLNYLMRIAEYKPEGWREAEWRIRFPVLSEHSFKSAIDAAIAQEKG
jgi:hypothetical protein